MLLSYQHVLKKTTLSLIIHAENGAMTGKDYVMIERCDRQIADRMSNFY